jgi:hypothetical protein
VVSSASSATQQASPVLRGGATLEALRLAARCARLADHAYFDCDTAGQPNGGPSSGEDTAAEAAPLAELLAADGLRLVASGRSLHTRYYVADEHAAGLGDWAGVRHLVFRGVAWRDRRVDSLQLATRLASAWRAPLAPGVPLHAHAGVLRCAEELWPCVEPHVRSALGAKGGPLRVAFSGHSLGGALALLSACACRLRAGVPPAALAPCHAFGAPPVLAVDPPQEALRLLQLPRGALRSFVLDTDPVPLVWRADLAAQALGYAPQGDLYWMRWEGARAASITRREGGVQASALVDPAAGAAMQQPLSLLALLRGALDHNRRSYSDALTWLVTLAEAEAGRGA